MFYNGTINKLPPQVGQCFDLLWNNQDKVVPYQELVNTMFGDINLKGGKERLAGRKELSLRVTLENMNYMKRDIGKVFFVMALGIVLSACTRGVVQDDGAFQRSAPELEGVQTDGILNFIDEAEANGIDMHSLMILRHGKIITQGWWYPYKPTYKHIMHSVSKTFTSTAIGFAVQEGLLTVNDKVIAFFPDDLPAEVSPYLQALTIKHLLTMSVGQEPAPTFYMGDDSWVKAFLSTPIEHEPGSVFLYSSYASYILSAIIQKVSGETTFDYLKTRLLDPLKIKDVNWEYGAERISAGGWGMRIKTEDMAKLGQFYLQKGRWNGKQLLPSAWIKEATSLQIFQRDSLTFEEELHDNWAQGYGYQIWRCINNAYRADGADGQFIIVMPDQDAVVIITENTANTQLVLRLVFDYLQPAMGDLVYSVKEDRKEQLGSKLSTLSIPDPFRTEEDLVVPKEVTRTYNLDSNTSGLQKVTFTFGAEGEISFSLQDADSTQTFDLGLDGWHFVSTMKPGPYFLSPRKNPEGLAPFVVAGYGSWVNKNELRIRLLYIEDYQEETYICRFDGKKVKIARSNSFRPNAEPQVLLGSLTSE
ncbi:hypothetical protein AGMMS49574_02870 [Bacteroidia bacterium]|nr:hypothetical protein AGMMS49574_02870 [Bacteroidia bacterium]